MLARVAVSAASLPLTIHDLRSRFRMPKTLTSHRSRLIVFRVTQEEFDELLLACRTLDARSLADFVRQSALHSARLRGSPEGRGVKASSLNDTLTRLNSTLTEIMRLLRTSPDDPIPTRSPLRDSSSGARSD